MQGWNAEGLPNSAADVHLSVQAKIACWMTITDGGVRLNIVSCELTNGVGSLTTDVCQRTKQRCALTNGICKHPVDGRKLTIVRWKLASANGERTRRRCQRLFDSFRRTNRPCQRRKPVRKRCGHVCNVIFFKELEKWHDFHEPKQKYWNWP